MSMDKISYDYKDYPFPENWREYKLNQLLEVVERPVNMIDDQEYCLITIKRNFGGIESRGKLTGKKILVKNQFEIREGDFIISKRQIVHGACAVVPKNYEGATVSNEYDVMNFNNRLLSLFFDYYVQLPFMRRYFYINSDGVHVEKLRFKTDDWLRQRIRVPSIIEQQHIASILATSDKAIRLKEQLIIEKKRQKKWLMQNLLTGKKRLSGFKSDWQKFEVGQVISLSSKKINPIIEKRVFKCIELEHIESETGRLLGSTISSMQKSNKNYFKNGDVLFGKLRPYLKKFYYATHEGVCSSEIWVLRPNNKNLLPQYLYYIVQSSQFIEKCCVSSGSKMPRADWDYVLNLVILLPPLSEQTIIAKTLAITDRAIDLHEKQLEELKKQKKALMQLLLTGIVRVNTGKVN
ncbi:type I restriction-modification system specificity subunit S [Desulfocucumis palustris]|uniref:Type I restriction-modification system specificity subunit S n=1 Tax=Desulfocucumis palustris TaxID=1898651 RepID=A0A2L2XB55_9FIRM|nr:restriction endonuclease subunit S [Desulfocucumis palustris]GBF33330.1 type I restriction-modification system specificity subunit S [Desulfocucumis palustris]